MWAVMQPITVSASLLSAWIRVGVIFRDTPEAN